MPTITIQIEILEFIDFSRNSFIQKMCSLDLKAMRSHGRL